MVHQLIDENAFRDFERRRHDAIAHSYHDFFSPVTALAVAELLNAAHVVANTRLLDVATGSGVAAGVAATRGAKVVGVDVAPNMVQVAASLNPALQFKEADVAALPFEDGAFDAVVCNFGLGHFANAERAIAECARVLAPLGSLAVSWWDHPSRTRIQGLFVDALQEAGATPPPDLPAGPPIFRFSEDSELLNLLRSAGLDGVRVQQYSCVHRIESVDALWNGALGSLARTSAVVLGQTVEMQRRIRACLERLATNYSTPEGLLIPVAFKIASGQRVPGEFVDQAAARIRKRPSASDA